MTRDGWLGQAQHTFGDVGARLEELCLSCTRDAGVDGAGLAVMASDGTPETVYATNELSARVEDLQFTLGEGPSAEVARSGAPLLMPGLDGEAHQLWPTFAKEAGVAGVAALFAFPIRIGTISLGTLALHRRTPGPLTTKQLARTFASVDTAAWLILAMTAGGLDGTVPEATYRMLVHQAAGMAMIQLDTTIEEALLRLRALAYSDGIPIHDLAADIVSRRRRLSKEEE